LNLGWIASSYVSDEFLEELLFAHRYLTEAQQYKDI